ncbi:MAG TPA: rhamnulokinase family protein [Roseiflexaceae bacterium]|nr:rhamnulokinase family protein [Roseiflexaceae bacterium]
MPDTANFLAFDLGASSGRALLGRWDGARFTLEELHRFDNGPVQVAGTLHWDVLRLWGGITEGIARYAAQHPEPLMGLGVDAWGVDFALLDASGRLLGNPVCYRDARTNGMLEEVTARIPHRRIFERTGIQFLQINTLYQLYSMARAADPQLRCAAALLMIPDLFHYWLSGRAAAEYTDASTTQFMRCGEPRWDTELLEELGVPATILPEIVPPGTLLGQLRPEILDETGLRHQAPVIAPASHDTASAVAAVPGLDEHSAYISSGTWSLVGVETPAPVVSEAALALNFTNEGGVAGSTRLLKNVTGLWLLQECRRRWRRAGRDYTWEQLLALAAHAPPLRSLVHPDAPDFLAPGDMPAAVRAFCHRTGQPEPEDDGAVVRCCLESLALTYRAVIESVERLTGRPVETIRVVGGGCRNQLLNQWTADACGRPVVAGPAEATALGNLLVQAVAAGLLADIPAARRALAGSVELEHFAPRPTADWDAAYERLRQIAT